jgi:hypothetical protein
LIQKLDRIVSQKTIRSEKYDPIMPIPGFNFRADITFKYSEVFLTKIPLTRIVSLTGTFFGRESIFNWKMLDNTFFQTKVDLENDGDLYSACSNPNNVVLVIVLSYRQGCLILGTPKLIDALYQRINLPGQ